MTSNCAVVWIMCFWLYNLAKPIAAFDLCLDDCRFCRLQQTAIIGSASTLLWPIVTIYAIKFLGNHIGRAGERTICISYLQRKNRGNSTKSRHWKTKKWHTWVTFDCESNGAIGFAKLRSQKHIIHTTAQFDVIKRTKIQFPAYCLLFISV